MRSGGQEQETEQRWNDQRERKPAKMAGWGKKGVLVETIKEQPLCALVSMCERERKRESQSDVYLSADFFSFFFPLLLLCPWNYGSCGLEFCYCQDLEERE